MSEIYISSTLMWNLPLKQLMELAHDLHAAGLEMWAQQFFFQGYDPTEYQYYAHYFNLKTLVHSCSWDLNLASINTAVRDASIKAVKDSIKLAHKIQAREVTVHPGHMTQPAFRKESTLLMQDSFQQIYEYAHKKNVPVSLEIMEKIKKEFVTDEGAMREVTGGLFDNFYYTLDLAHCDSTEEMFHLLDTMPHLSKLHISNRKGPKYHTPIPEGDFPFAELLPRLNAYGIPMVVEGCDTTPDLKVLHKNIDFLVEQGGFR